MDGHSAGFFNCKKGVRQGDRLSPLLFCIDEDVLRKGIALLVNSGKSKPMASPRGFQTPSHVMYANDIMVFCKGTQNNLRTLMSFEEYGDISGQKLSLGKCTFYAGSVS